MSKPKQQHKAVYYLSAAVWLAALVFLDQKIKLQVVDTLKGQPGRSIIPGILGLQYVENRGMAFGLMQGGGLFFIILTVVIAAALGIAYHALPEKRRFIPLAVGCVAVSAGAISNCIDRIRLGYVIDYLELEFIRFPVFNLADCFITWTAVIMAILITFFYRTEDFEQIHL